MLGGIPGAGKSTLLRRLFPGGTEDGGVRVFDSGWVRDRWRPVLGGVPYSWWRPVLHLTYYGLVLRAMRAGGPLVVHDCATRPWVRRLIGWRARRSGLAVHLVLLDVPEDVARSGQHARGRVVRSGSMDKHSRRWPRLLERAAEEPGRVVPGAASAVVLDRRGADQLEKISFEPN
ncbi:AAA family ATPase [Kribbella caucasensis]|uniref:AAA family ATPase n=1 Tax=Kribbella caucasensis TaxID=2512215 RepID=UPI001EDD8115|nr:AAA family ATPase [Kribbella sp. VKM Ac-2527]